MSNPTPMFSNTRNTVFNGGTFNQYSGSEIDQRERENAMNRLIDAVAHSAFHNSAARFDPPKCHPNTRVAVLNNITDWVVGNNPDERNEFILWLSGAAGCGKSSIAQSLVERAIPINRILASFFFGRNDPTRNHCGSLIATIAYQIGTAFPIARRLIEDAILKDPLIFKRSFDFQISHMITIPLQHLSTSGFFTANNSPLLLVIDGLDECLDSNVRCGIIKSISNALSSFQLPLKVLVASRPEPDISNTFLMENRVFRIVLDDDYRAIDDIRLFLHDNFVKIKQFHPLRHHIRTDWPSHDDILKLTNKSSGQFIYASTVVKYVSSIRHNPMDRLDVILGLCPANRDMPFVELDEIYRLVLSTATDIELTLDILAVGLWDTISYHCMEDYDVFLNLSEGTAQLLMTDLASIVHCEFNQFVSSTSPKLRFHHASLEDFLLDCSRSREYYINPDVRNHRFAMQCIHGLQNMDIKETEKYPCLIYYYLPLYSSGNLAHYCSNNFTEELQQEILKFSMDSIIAQLKTCSFAYSLCIVQQLANVFLEQENPSKKTLLPSPAFNPIRQHLEILFQNAVIDLFNYYSKGFKLKLSFLWLTLYHALLEKHFQSADLLCPENLSIEETLHSCSFLLGQHPSPKASYSPVKILHNAGIFAAENQIYEYSTFLLLKYLCDYHNQISKIIPGYNFYSNDMKRRKHSPWLWHLQVGRFCSRQKWHNKMLTKNYLSYHLNGNIESFKAGLGFLPLLLKRCGKSDDLITLACCRHMAPMSLLFPKEASCARRAMVGYTKKYI